MEGLFGFDNEDALIAVFPRFARNEHLGKFEGERLYVQDAHELWLNGFEHDSFGDLGSGGHAYARVFVPVTPFTTPFGTVIKEIMCCFCMRQDGFVIEMSNRDYECAHAAWVEANEQEEQD